MWVECGGEDLKKQFVMEKACEEQANVESARKQRVVRVVCGGGYVCEQTVEGTSVEWRYVTWTACRFTAVIQLWLRAELPL